MALLFGMGFLQATGYVESQLRLNGLEWAVPGSSALSRRQKTLKVNIPNRGSEEPLHLLIDSTDIKGAGAGEWNFRKNGFAKRRVSRTIYMGIDEKS